VPWFGSSGIRAKPDLGEKECDLAGIQEALAGAERRLVDELGAGGFWEGRLSGSALSTAVAVFALARADGERDRGTIADGVGWLCRNVNGDGGWGDTTRSDSNLSTTLLVWSALSSAERSGPVAKALSSAEGWLLRKIGSLKPDGVARAVIRRYGNDKTFAAPILAMCAMAGLLGPGATAWNHVPRLPFELAIVPRALYRCLSLSVVSYALPALIAVGLLRHKMSPGRAPVRLLRNLCEKKAISILERIQPSGGGFLEATPLTGFVTMSLVAAGYTTSTAVERGVAFLLRSARQDGSWPIDTNLSTWLTTLSINALPARSLSDSRRSVILKWLLGQQHLALHPYTNAGPGGWAWTDLSGGVPDADDTASALLALRKLGGGDESVCHAAVAGVRWLIDLQNRDGGIPTFCRGWGKLPFDRSCPDITAHAIKALQAWRHAAGDSLAAKIDSTVERSLRYLVNSQREDGSWVPLWFGNQAAPGSENPVYGTACVLKGLAGMEDNHVASTLTSSGRAYLRHTQHGNGGWGGAEGVVASIEETALATAALSQSRNSQDAETARRGTNWLLEATKDGSEFPASPIGLYFASLWYFEKLYPLIFTVEALRSGQL